LFIKRKNNVVVGGHGILKIHAARPLTTAAAAPPGQIVHIGKTGITVATAAGDLLLTALQLEGKKRLPAFDIANGLRLKPGDRFGPGT
jgi:methionyl-tRNA formyltransferase